MKTTFKKLISLIALSLMLTACSGTPETPSITDSSSEPTTSDISSSDITSSESSSEASSEESSESSSEESSSESSEESSSSSSEESSESSETTESSSESSSSSSTSDTPTDYYADVGNLEGSALQAKLKDINAPKSTSYDWSRYEDADEALDDSDSILCIYTRHNIPKSNHCGNYAWDKWNREHIWTQSAYPKSASDNHNIFACEGQINNYRGNLKYAMGGDVVTVFGHVTDCKLVKNTSFEPCDAAKGEVARSVMYGTVQYSYTMTNIIDSIELALEWHLEHEITERETRRNDVVHKNQGNRNPFVDHPEYACRIWGRTNSKTKALCGIN